jgi:glutaredoxin 1
MYTIYGKPGCTYCTKAKALLDSKGIQYNYINVDDLYGESNRRQIFTDFHDKIGTHSTFPLVFKDTVFIGGFTNLEVHVAVAVEAETPKIVDDF